MKDQDLNQIIRKIDEKIRMLQNAKKVLIEEFGKGMEQEFTRPIPYRQDVSRRRETRKNTIIRILREHGPMKVVEMIEKTGLSRGTIGWVLNDKKTFMSLGDGRWDLIERMKEKE